MTDETYSVLATPPDTPDHQQVTLIGLDFVLAALFAVLTVEQWLQKHSIVQRLGAFLPLAIMTLLRVHSMVGSAAENPSGPWPGLLAVTLVELLQGWSRHALLRILGGTGVYLQLRNLNIIGA